MSRARSPQPNRKSDSGAGLFPSLRRDLAEEPWKYLCFVLAAAAIIQAWDNGEQVACMDYYQFWTVGQVIRHEGSANIYSDAERLRLGEVMWQRVEARIGTNPDAQGASKQYQAGARRPILETYSTPFLYSIFGVSATGDYDRDQDRFQLFSLACLVLGLALLCSLADYSPAASAVAVIFFLALFGPMGSDVSVGNVGRVQVALVALFLWLLGGSRSPTRCLAAGFVLGLAILFKPNLLFVGLMVALGCAFSKQYPKLFWSCAGMATGASAGIVFSSAYGCTWRCWLNWAAEMPRLMNEYDAPVTRGNFALSKAIEEITGLNATMVVAPALLGAAFFILWRSGKLETNGSSPMADMRSTALGCLVSLLIVRLAWLHYYMLTIIPILFLLRPAERILKHPVMRALALAGAVMVAANSGRIPARFRPDVLTLALTTSAGAILLLGLVLLEYPLRRRILPRKLTGR